MTLLIQRDPIASLLKADLKIKNRTIHVMWLLAITIASLLLLHVVGTGLVPNARFALLAVVLCYFVSGFNFIDLLTGGINERTLYRVVAVNLDRVVLAKNSSAVILFATLLIPALLIEAVAFKASAEIIAGACLYAVTSIFVVLHLGNYASVRLERERPWNNSPVVAIVESGVVLIGSLPYWILSSLLHHVLFCTLFTFLAAASWYFLSIPSTSKLLRLHKDAQGNEQQH